MMPEMDGFTLAKEVRLIDPKIPILFLTAKAMKEDKLEGFESGADDYMTKPFTMEELLARIEAILRRTAPSDNDENEMQQIGNIQYEPVSRILHLKEENKKAQEVCTEVGFKNLSHFSTAFKKQYGIPPTEI